MEDFSKNEGIFKSKHTLIYIYIIKRDPLLKLNHMKLLYF